MAQQVKPEIVIGGTTLEHFTHLQIDQSLFTHHTFQIAVPFEVLESKNDFFFKKSHSSMVGKPASIKFKPIYKNVSADFQFAGIVTELTLINNSDMTNSFLIKGHSPTFLMEDGVQRRAWVEKDLSTIVNDVLGAYSFNKGVNVNFKDKIDYKTQYDESNWDFLRRVCQEYGEWCYYTGSKLIVGETPLKEEPFVADGVQHFSMSVGVKPNQIEMMHYNYKKHERYSGKSKPLSALGTFGTFAYQTSSSLFGNSSLLWPLRDAQSKGDVDSAVDAMNKTNATDMVRFNGHGENPNLGVGVVVNVTAQKLEKPNVFKQESGGKYRINHITHTVDEVGNYANDFEAVPYSAEAPPRNPYVHTPTALPEIATVKFNNDPLQLGRVKVEFHWPNQLVAKSSWIRVAFPYTGSDRGSLFIPEVDDQVVISYEANHVDFPMVVGSIYHKSPSTNYWFPNNEQKIIRTKGGNKIVMKDKPGEQEFFITNANNKNVGLHVSFKGDGKIQIYAENGEIEVRAKNIKMHAKENIELQAKNIQMQASQNASLKSGSNTEINGTTTDVKGSTVNVKGTMVKIN
ncbi:type VI secretion system Vgr family protein [Fibrella sp. WM1]|uniref:type VI secretion system Vgr family protein n=1 Tax=Fibrella musci TaxID=3242485 RepID=UPI003520B330